jgi:hypothetical protein
MIPRVLTLLVVLSMSTVSAQAGTIVFGDGDFDDTDWTIELFNFHTGGTASAGQVATGGNLDNFRRADHTTNAATDPADNAAIYAFHGYTLGVIDPSVDGAIASVDFFWDVRAVEGAGQFSGPALRQGDRFYVSAGLLELIGSDPQWRTVERLNVVESSFGLIRDILEIDPASDPDFSASGEPVTFGFFSALAGGLGGPGVTSSAGYDNWRVEIETVPEPGAATLMVLAALLGLTRRFS